MQYRTRQRARHIVRRDIGYLNGRLASRVHASPRIILLKETCVTYFEVSILLANVVKFQTHQDGFE